MRAGAGLGVVLDGESLFGFDANAFNGFIIEVDVGDFDIGAFLDVAAAHFEAVVLRGDLRLAGDEIFDRMIETSVSVGHLVGPDA